MVLLGSIQRTELIDLLKRHIGHERRVKIAAQRRFEIQTRYGSLGVGWIFSFHNNKMPYVGVPEILRQ